MDPIEATQRKDVAYLVVVELNGDRNPADVKASLLGIIDSHRNSDMVFSYVPPDEGLGYFTAVAISSMSPAVPKQFEAGLAEKLRPLNATGLRARTCAIDPASVTRYENAQELQRRIMEAAETALPTDH